MSEILNECDVHPNEDRTFRSSVLKTLMARQILSRLLPVKVLNPGDASLEFITAKGIDVVWSELANDCATRIAEGTCHKYTLQVKNLSVRVEPRIQNEQY